MSSESSSANPVQGAESAAAAAPSTGAPASHPAAPAAPGYNSMTTIGTMAELKEKAPEVYNAMLQGIGMSICNEMKDHQDRIKKIMRDAERDAEGHS